MTTTPAFASVREAADIVREGLGFLANADATQLAAETQAQCLQVLEQVHSMGTAARASILGAFTAGQGYSADADYSPRAWLIHKTRITKGAAVGYTAWARRAAAHPLVAAALAEGAISESYARTICAWTDKLPQDCRQAADEILAGAARSGMDLADLAGLAGEIYARSRPEDPGQDRDQGFGDRSVKLETTFQGAGVLTGDLSPECASIVGTVLDALSAPAGAEDDRSQAQRYHDALHEALQRLVTAGLLPERAGQPVKAWAHISLADLMVLDGSSALQQEWTSRVRAAWAARRAQASAGGGDGGAWLDGDAAAAVACDAAVAPVVTGEVNPDALEDLVRLCVQLDRLGHRGAVGDTSTDDGTSRGDGGAEAGRGSAEAGGGSAEAGSGGAAARRGPRPARSPPGPGRRSNARSSARPSTWSRVRAGWRRSCAAGSTAPGSAGPACRWTSATPRPSPPASATRSSCGTGTASGPGGATSPPRRARCTTSGTRPTAARPASKTACSSASSIIRW